MRKGKEKEKNKGNDLNVTHMSNGRYYASTAPLKGPAARGAPAQAPAPEQVHLWEQPVRELHILCMFYLADKFLQIQTFQNQQQVTAQPGVAELPQPHQHGPQQPAKKIAEQVELEFRNARSAPLDNTLVLYLGAGQSSNMSRYAILENMDGVRPPSIKNPIIDAH